MLQRGACAMQLRRCFYGAVSVICQQGRNFERCPTLLLHETKVRQFLEICFGHSFTINWTGVHRHRSRRSNGLQACGCSAVRFRPSFQTDPKALVNAYSADVR
jgi:hypothetical protein